jgi:hypothetical protein
MPRLILLYVRLNLSVDRDKLCACILEYRKTYDGYSNFINILSLRIAVSFYVKRNLKMKYLLALFMKSL